MGKGSLKRIAALTVLATAAVMFAGVASTPALPGTPTVPTTTVTVPQTPVTPETTVTTPPVAPPQVSPPQVSAPAPSAPKASPPQVSAPKISPPKASPPKVSPPSAPAPKAPGGGTAPRKAVSELTSPVTSGGGGGGTVGTSPGSGSLSTGSVSTGVLSGAGATGAALSGRALRAAPTGSPAAGAAAGGAGNPALDALAVYSGGGSQGGGPGAASVGRGSGASAARLPATLSGAGARHLRATLELLEGCMSAIAPIDRQVLGMRAGAPGTAPLSRRQVAAQLGLSGRQVARFERRGLSGLRSAAEQTGCAGPVGGPFAVSGIGALSFAPLAAPLPATAKPAGTGAGGEGTYVPARQAEPGGTSPLARLAEGGQSGPAWLVILFTVLFSVSIAGLMRELRNAVAP